MRRLVIAVDCDDVLVATTPFFIDAYNEKYGTNVPHAFARVDDVAVWGEEEPVVIERWRQLMETDAYKQLGPSQEEAAVLRELAQHHELHLVTARREHERVLTQEMLDRELQGVFTSMEFVGLTGSKGEVCQRIGADVLIDDNAHHLHDSIEKGLAVNGAILFGDYPWNADSDTTNLKRCATWQDVAEYIHDLQH